jgi:hypothetical protein
MACEQVFNLGSVSGAYCGGLLPVTWMESPMRIVSALWRATVVLALAVGAALIVAGPAAAMRPTPDCAGLYANLRYWADEYSLAQANHDIFWEPIAGQYYGQAWSDYVGDCT